MSLIQRTQSEWSGFILLNSKRLSGLQVEESSGRNVKLTVH